MYDTTHLDEHYRLLYNQFGIFLQKDHKRNKKYRNGSVKTRWRTVGMYKTETEALVAWLKILKGI